MSLVVFYILTLVGLQYMQQRNNVRVFVLCFDRRGIKDQELTDPTVKQQEQSSNTIRDSIKILKKASIMRFFDELQKYLLLNLILVSKNSKKIFFPILIKNF